MTRILVIAVLVVAAGVVAGGAGGQRESRRDFVVPKIWGTFRGVYHDQLLFEDDRGTIRSVYPNSTTVVFTITRR